jgi:DnaK suppressor protein
MDSATLARFKDLLESERTRLEAEIEHIDHDERDSLSEASGENAYRDHMGDQGTATFEREMDMSLEENVRLELGAVLGALRRIETGSYGTCERCSAEIPVERLEAVPTASMCIRCKEADESR